MVFSIFNIIIETFANLIAFFAYLHTRSCRYLLSFYFLLYSPAVSQAKTRNKTESRTITAETKYVNNV